HPAPFLSPSQIGTPTRSLLLFGQRPTFLRFLTTQTLQTRGETMKVSQLTTKNVSVPDLETTLEEIATMMRDEDAGAIPVLDDEKLVGIVTDRDIVVRCIAEGRDPVGTTSEDILSPDLTTIRPNDDVDTAARVMSQRQVRRLPVVDESGNLVGMLSLGDIAVKEDGDA